MTTGPRVAVTFTLSPEDYADGFDCDPQALAVSVRARLAEILCPEGDGCRIPRYVSVQVTCPPPTPAEGVRVVRPVDPHAEPAGRLGLSLGAVRRVADRLDLHPGVVLARLMGTGIPVRHVERV